VAEAVDRHLRGYVDAYGRLGAQWIVVHAGYHFTSDKELRMDAGLERLKRLVDYAEQKNPLILFENLNKEPTDAEVHYLAHTIEEWQFYFERIRSPAFKLSFTVNHAHLLGRYARPRLRRAGLGRNPNSPDDPLPTACHQRERQHGRASSGEYRIADHHQRSKAQYGVGEERV